MGNIFLKIWDIDTAEFKVKDFEKEEVTGHISLTERHSDNPELQPPPNTKSTFEYRGQKFWNSDDVQPSSTGK